MRHLSIFRRVVLAILAATATGALAGTIPAASRKAAPDFSLTDAQGATVKLSQFKGKVVLLNFWATWCHGCKTEIPWYVEFQSAYQAEGLSVIGVSMDENWKPVRPFLQEHNVNYIVGIGDDALSRQYHVSSMPVSLLIDRDGRIAESHVGVVDRAAFESDIASLLKENSTLSSQPR